uniref:Uncharacterized protein n=1 Tax=Heterorhabditis bacteriophora TaxID=37862 RepID=A0A1I7X2F0_HETBA
MSAIFDSRGNIFPRLLRPAHNEIRTGARDRLSTPPRKDCITTSSISTDFSQESVGIREPPLVEPELSDSDIDENVFLEVSLPSFPERRARRETSRRCEIPLSECTSPSSASSRDPSEAMASSRSSFLELIGFRKKRDNLQSTTSLLSSTKPILKKRKRRVSEDELIASGLYSKNVRRYCIILLV